MLSEILLSLLNNKKPFFPASFSQSVGSFPAGKRSTLDLLTFTLSAPWCRPCPHINILYLELVQSLLSYDSLQEFSEAGDVPQQGFAPWKG